MPSQPSLALARVGPALACNAKSLPSTVDKSSLAKFEDSLRANRSRLCCRRLPLIHACWAVFVGLAAKRCCDRQHCVKPLQ